MSRDYMVLLIKGPTPDGQIDGQPAEVFMCFTEAPTDSFLLDLSLSRPGWRVYSLSGASSWVSACES